MGVLQTLRGAWVIRALILLAFAARAVIPAGYMLNASAPGKGVTVIFCSAHGLLQVVVDPVTGEVSYEQKTPDKLADQDDPPCAFSSIAKLAPPTVGIHVPLPVPSAVVAIEPATAPSPGRGLSAPPPPSTGPPVSIA